MSDVIKLYSDIERCEIINIDDGKSYENLGDNDILIDENGNFKFLQIAENKKRFTLMGKTEYSEIPWEYITKVGPKKIIMDVKEEHIKKQNI